MRKRHQYHECTRGPKMETRECYYCTAGAFTRILLIGYDFLLLQVAIMPNTKTTVTKADFSNTALFGPLYFEFFQIVTTLAHKK